MPYAKANRKLSDDDVKKIYKSTYSASILAEIYNVSIATIHNIWRGKTFTDVTRHTPNAVRPRDKNNEGIDRGKLEVTEEFIQTFERGLNRGLSIENMCTAMGFSQRHFYTILRHNPTFRSRIDAAKMHFCDTLVSKMYEASQNGDIKATEFMLKYKFPKDYMEKLVYEREALLNIDYSEKTKAALLDDSVSLKEKSKCLMEDHVDKRLSLEAVKHVMEALRVKDEEGKDAQFIRILPEDLKKMYEKDK